MTSVAPQQRFTRSRPCPICFGFDGAVRGRSVRCFGFLSEDGQWGLCTREEHAGNLTPQGNSGAYMHRLAGPCACGIEHGLILARTEPEARRKRSRPDTAAPEGVLECVHTYFDEAGCPVHRTVRYRDPKTFRQQRYENGAWRWGLKDTRLVLYRLPQLLAAHPSRPVFLVEGERDADRLAELLCVVTTNVHGARSWLPYYNDWLRDRRVYIVQDNDADGAKRTRLLTKELGPVARAIDVITFPELPAGGDLCDWLDLHPGYGLLDLIGRSRDVALEVSA